MIIQSKCCEECGKPMKGRADKKFCNGNCRNNFNNQLKATSNNFVRNINNALGKNRRILESLLPENEEMIRVPKEKLLQAGFQFRYLTHIHRNKNGSNYFYCYDHGYLLLEGDCYLLVKNKDL